MKLNRSFFSLYFVVITLFILSSWIIDEVWRSYIENDINSYTGYETMLVIVGDYLEKHPQEQWPVIINSINAKYGTLLNLLPFKKLENANRKDKKSLIRGNTYVHFNNEEVMLHYLLPHSNMLITIGPTKMPTRPRLEALVRVIVLAIFGAIMFIWLRPMSRDLDQLRNSTNEIGKGNFSVKVNEAKSMMVAPMIESFNMMASQIKRLIDAHKELSNAVAHELRTPLARSKFSLQMLENTDDEVKKRKYCNNIGNDIIELEELVNEMLIYASFDSEKPELNFSPVLIDELISKQLNNHSHYNGQIIFNNGAQNQEVECDLHFISRALDNYITNAVKYGDNIIQVSLDVNKSFCTITVEDNGQGVTEEFKTNIFDAFSRGDASRNKDTGGFGLGLAIVSRVMEWHKGITKVKDSNLGGAAFILQWPVKQKNKTQ